MKDGPARTVIKFLALARYMFDLKVTRAIYRLRGESRFLLRGSCNRCGGCCETPMIHTHPVLFRLRSVRSLSLWWHRVVNGFELIRAKRSTYTYIFRCTHWDPETKLCDSYRTRPGLCRDYPRNLLDSIAPDFLPECGFYALDRKADIIRESIADLDLTPAKREELERRLYIKE